MCFPLNLVLFTGMAHVPFFILIVGVAGLLYTRTCIAGIVSMPPVQWQVCQSILILLWQACQIFHGKCATPMPWNCHGKQGFPLSWISPWPHCLSSLNVVAVGRPASMHPPPPPPPPFFQQLQVPFRVMTNNLAISLSLWLLKKQQFHTILHKHTGQTLVALIIKVTS